MWCRYMVPPQRGGVVPTPARQLLDFERVHVAKGATTFVSFSITASQLQLVRARASDLSSQVRSIRESS